MVELDVPATLLQRTVRNETNISGFHFAHALFPSRCIRSCGAGFAVEPSGARTSAAAAGAAARNGRCCGQETAWNALVAHQENAEKATRVAVQLGNQRYGMDAMHACYCYSRLLIVTTPSRAVSIDGSRTISCAIPSKYKPVTACKMLLLRFFL